MPDVSSYDNEKDWMAACVPTRLEEGDDQDQAVAACMSIWREREKSKARGEGPGVSGYETASTGVLVGRGISIWLTVQRRAMLHLRHGRSLVEGVDLTQSLTRNHVFQP